MDRVPDRVAQPTYETLKAEKAERLKEYKSYLYMVSSIGLLAEKARTATQQAQYLKALDFLRENIEDFYRLMTEQEFQSIIFFEEDNDVHSWVTRTLSDPYCKVPPIPDKLTPRDIERITLHLFKGQTTLSGILEELEPAYKRWLEHEDRCRKIWKAISCIDKEWQAEALFQIVVPPEIWHRIRKVSETLATVKMRMESLVAAQAVISRIITLFQITPIVPLSRQDVPTGGAEPAAQPTVTAPSPRHTPADGESKFGVGQRRFGRRFADS